ncbi:RNase H family protein [Blastopirellula marina]|uniref:Probable ribonuclease HI n=1 Tax=Blastopirellula marina DSM 3645 TaxID=314230 RepID=A3ZXA0_9BACT|nr:RNase H family protein [Blastopirellula marina]EAQ78857.1 probable ribonuclease HI [Blastopirellula marina DSM 3645]
MNESTPLYLLFCESAESPYGGTWRFVLEGVGQQERLVASGEETWRDRDRLALLSVVRGLEALPEPSRVTLLTPSRYVSRGFRYGLSVWRESGFRWERFGRLAPVRDADLWQRVSQAMQFHRVDCRPWRFEMIEAEEAAENNQPASRTHFSQHRKRRTIRIEEQELTAAAG